MLGGVVGDGRIRIKWTEKLQDFVLRFISIVGDHYHRSA